MRKHSPSPWPGESREIDNQIAPTREESVVSRQDSEWDYPTLTLYSDS
jgi:hypothetical protein